MCIVLPGPAPADVQRLKPLTETLQDYGIQRMPDEEAYPDAAAVVVLSELEYRQLGNQHERRIHKIIKVLTEPGASAAKIVLPCTYSCHVEGRTIKPDGRMISLPGKDIVHSEQRSEFTSAYSMVQFLIPSAEPGDLLEYIATLTYPYPFMAEDFRFAEPYPVRKAVLILTHPIDFSYSYIKVESGNSINIRNDTFQEGPFRSARTLFATDNVPAAIQEPYAAASTGPGLKLFINGMNGTRFEYFRDWKKFGELVGKGFRVSAQRLGPIKDFILEQVKKAPSDPDEQMRLIHDAADRRIEIVSIPNRMLVGLPFQTVEEVFKEKSGTAEDFALFLATCFRSNNWAVDLLLVNSSEKPQTGKDLAFPPDLDLVFLKVKTPANEYYIDCNSNGVPVGMLSSVAMNRFALGVPVLLDFQNVTATSYITTMPSPQILQSRLDVKLAGAGETWTAQVQWDLRGDLYKQLVAVRRSRGEDSFRRGIAEFVRSNAGLAISKVDFLFLSGGIQINAAGSFPRRKLDNNLELLQNPFADSIVNLPSSVFENRKSPVLLPLSGEVSATYHIDSEAGRFFSVPGSYEIQCNPLMYTFTAVPSGSQLTIQERWLIRGLQIQPGVFPQFQQLSRYASQNHNWSVLLTPSGSQPAASPTQKVSLIPFSGPVPTPLPLPKAVAAKAPTAKLVAAAEVPCKDTSRAQVTGSLKNGNLLLRIKNLSSVQIERFDLTILYGLTNGTTFKQPVHQNVAIPAQGSHFLAFPAETLYDSIDITVQFLQKGVWHECGPFRIKEDE